MPTEREIVEFVEANKADIFAEQNKLFNYARAGIFAKLTPEQQEQALAYRGDDF